MNILIVEDDKVLSLMLQKMVERIGHNVSAIIAEGSKAVDYAINNENCDLILMDIMLEDNLDGIEAYKLISAQKKIPVIYITGNSDPLNLERANEYGYHDYMIKPVVYDDLENSINNLSVGS